MWTLTSYRTWLRQTDYVSFSGSFCLPVRSMTILVKFITPSASSSIEGGLLLSCDVPRVKSVCDLALQGSILLASKCLLLHLGPSMSLSAASFPLDLKKPNSLFAKSLFDPAATKECFLHFNWRILSGNLFQADKDLFKSSFSLSTLFCWIQIV